MFDNERGARGFRCEDALRGGREMWKRIFDTVEQRHAL
jgi:hypothetical protein